MTATNHHDDRRGGTMEQLVPDHPVTDTTSSWSVHGDPALLVEAAQRLRLGIEMGVYRSHPPGEYAMFGLARLLDAVAFSMHVDGAVHHTVVSGATEIAHHVLKYLLPTVRSDAHRA
ncbi:hypothetical protein [Pseudonocardia humida]|uniref:TetR family transcriptional regulator n=1 Tax=Pseudonocardia humida TaxID=2800819 RepID=A0ABT1AA85_9PSEU|nr:hypothetical protein [Pseudonocardia humida]MCO1659923.1 hypothetical protein [Pseudonocardia humida]